MKYHFFPCKTHNTYGYFTRERTYLQLWSACKATSKPLSWGLKNHPLVIWRTTSMIGWYAFSKVWYPWHIHWYIGLSTKFWTTVPTSPGRPGAFGGFRGPGAGLGEGGRGGAAGVGALATGAEAENGGVGVLGMDFLGSLGCFFSVGMILRLGDGSFDRFWTIVRELETDILNCFLDGLQDFLMDFRELGPTQHVNQHRSFWWILFQIETSSFQTFRCLNWNGIIWAGPPLFHTSPDTSGVSVLGAKRVWPELCVNRRSGCTWRRAWRFGSRRKRNMLVRRPKRTFWVLGFGCG